MAKIKNEIVNSLWYLMLKVGINIVFTIEYTYLLWMNYGKTTSAGFICLATLWGIIIFYAVIVLILDIIKIVKEIKK